MQLSDPSIIEVHRPPAFRKLVICDPDDPLTSVEPGSLVLGVGLHPPAAARLLAAIAPGPGMDAPVLVVSRPGKPAAAQALLDVAAEHSCTLLFRPEGTSWDELYRGLADGQVPLPIAVDDELADLAETIATLTGGLVSIEDTSSRMLAYSRSSDDVDDLRRLSILGRSGPQAYLQLLRDWGIYDRLAASEDVIEIDEHPASGVRRRLAVGIFAGHRQLGTIWVQQGRTEFPPHAKQALLGAARLTADQLTAGRGRAARSTVDAEAVAALLTGRASSIRTITGRAARQPCAVAVFDLGEEAVVSRGPATAEFPDDDRAAGRLAADDLAAIVTVHLAAFRRNALTTVIDGRTFALLPSLTEAAGGRLDPVSAVLRRAVGAARSHLRPSVRCALGPPVPTVSEAARSSAGAQLALSLPDRYEPLISFTEVRAQLAVNEAVEGLLRRPELRSTALDTLTESAPAIAHTVLRVLDHGGQLTAVATELGIHVTTVRYRLRRAAEITGIDLDDADERLAAQLQLRAAHSLVLHPSQTRA